MNRYTRNFKYPLSLARTTSMTSLVGASHIVDVRPKRRRNVLRKQLSPSLMNMSERMCSLSRFWRKYELDVGYVSQIFEYMIRDAYDTGDNALMCREELLLLRGSTTELNCKYIIFHARGIFMCCIIIIVQLCSLSVLPHSASFHDCLASSIGGTNPVVGSGFSSRKIHSNQSSNTRKFRRNRLQRNENATTRAPAQASRT